VTPDRRIRLHEALGHVGEDWNGTRLAQGRRALHRKRRRRRAARALSGSAVVAAAAVVAWLALPSGAPGVGMEAPPVADGTMRFHDGSSFLPLDARAALTVEHDGAEDIRVALLEGAGRFDVVPDAERHFVVDVRGVRVEVLGTQFETELDGSRVYVRVLQGRVLVTWSGGRRILTRGQSGLFPIGSDVAAAGREPLEDDAPSAEDAPPSLSEPSANDLEAVDMTFDEGDPAVVPLQRSRAPRRATTKTPSTNTEDWRRLARRGDYASAYHASRRQAVGTDIEDLLLAADAARLSGHPRDAVTYLHRAVKIYPKEPRAHLAAFTLGRVYLQLGRQAEAAESFATARRLDTKGVLGEQALAREVEAWAGAGKSGKATARAREYEKVFPGGRYTERVRRYRSGP
jgi:transmembrane sensor